MGVHTGDSITVAPAQTLTDKEYQLMRDASFAVIREIGVETGGSNIQFAVNPQTGPDGGDRDEPARLALLARWPRRPPASPSPRSRPSWPSATARRAPERHHARDAGQLRADDRLRGDKVPRFAFEKFPDADAALTTPMKTVGEAMAIGRTFKESFQKALRWLEVGRFGFGCDGKDLWGTLDQPTIGQGPGQAGHARAHERVWHLRYAIKYGMPVEEIYELTGIDPWFLENLARSSSWRSGSASWARVGACDDATLRRAKQFGFSDRQLATLWATTEMDVRADAQAPRHRGHLQVGRHLRRRVRGLHALLLFDLRGRGRDARRRSPTQGGS